MGLVLNWVISFCKVRFRRNIQDIIYPLFLDLPCTKRAYKQKCFIGQKRGTKSVLSPADHMVDFVFLSVGRTNNFFHVVEKEFRTVFSMRWRARGRIVLRPNRPDDMPCYSGPPCMAQSCAAPTRLASVVSRFCVRQVWGFKKPFVFGRTVLQTFTAGHNLALLFPHAWPNSALPFLSGIWVLFFASGTCPK